MFSRSLPKSGMLKFPKNQDFLIFISVEDFSRFCIYDLWCKMLLQMSLAHTGKHFSNTVDNLKVFIGI